MKKATDLLPKVLDKRAKIVLYAILQTLKKKSSKSVSPIEVSKMCDALNYHISSFEATRVMNLLNDMDILEVASSKEKLYKLAVDPVELENALKQDPELYALWS